MQSMAMSKVVVSIVELSNSFTENVVKTDDDFFKNTGIHTPIIIKKFLIKLQEMSLTVCEVVYPKR